jgi:hypothetical protein
MAFHSLKYSYVGTCIETIIGKPIRIWIRNTVFSFQIYGFAICGLGHTREIFGFAICGLIIKNLRIFVLRTVTPQKFSALRLRNKSKNLRICDLRTNNKNLMPTFSKYTRALNNGLAEKGRGEQARKPMI